MKEIKELKFEELTTKQKLGLTLNAQLNGTCEGDEFVYDLIRERALGSIWIQQNHDNTNKVLAKIKEKQTTPYSFSRMRAVA